MTINNHIREFGGLKIREFSPDEAIPSPPNCAMRLAMDWDAYEAGETFESLFGRFLADAACAEVEAVVIGDWGGSAEGNDSQPVVEALVSARDRLPKLRALFLGELTMEESEISWIIQSDVSPLFEAFPKLEELYIRGGEGLSLGRPVHATLRKLVIETGGMSANIVHDVTSAQLPALEHLELWLGDDAYGNDISSDDIADLLSQGPVGNLHYLGLRDDCSADETAKTLAERGIPASIETLDLSMGVLGDEGADALADCSWIKSLKKLDIHFHYVSASVVERLMGTVTAVDASDRQEPDEYDGESHRYVAVAE